MNKINNYVLIMYCFTPRRT